MTLVKCQYGNNIYMLLNTSPSIIQIRIREYGLSQTRTNLNPVIRGYYKNLIKLSNLLEALFSKCTPLQNDLTLIMLHYLGFSNNECFLPLRVYMITFTDELMASIRCDKSMIESIVTSFAHSHIMAFFPVALPDFPILQQIISYKSGTIFGVIHNRCRLILRILGPPMFSQSIQSHITKMT